MPDNFEVFIFRIGILVLWTLVLLFVLSMPALPIVPPSGIFMYWDKIAHLALFAVMGVVSVYGSGFFRSFGARLGFGVAFSLFLAFGTEFAQVFIPSRDANVFDLTANLLGTFIGLFVYVTAYLHEGLRSYLKL